MKKSTIGLLAIALIGCANSPDYYRRQSSMELCVDYMTLPSYNINQSTRARVLAERGETCNAYAGMAIAKGKADARNMQMLQQAQQMNARPTPQTQTYIVNGRPVTCTTTGSVTNCN